MSFDYLSIMQDSSDGGILASKDDEIDYLSVMQSDPNAIDLTTPSLQRTWVHLGAHVLHGLTAGMAFDPNRKSTYRPLFQVSTKPPYVWRNKENLYYEIGKEGRLDRIVGGIGEFGGAMLPVVATFGGAEAVVGSRMLSGAIRAVAGERVALGAARVGLGSRAILPAVEQIGLRANPFLRSLAVNTIGGGAYSAAGIFRTTDKPTTFRQRLWEAGFETATWAAIPVVTHLGAAGIRKYAPTAKLWKWMSGRFAKVTNTSTGPVAFPITEQEFNPARISLITKLVQASESPTGFPIGNFSEEESGELQDVILNYMKENDVPRNDPIRKVWEKLTSTSVLIPVGQETHAAQLNSVFLRMANDGRMNFTDPLHQTNEVQGLRGAMLKARQTGVPQRQAIVSYLKNSSAVQVDKKGSIATIARAVLSEAPLESTNPVDRIVGIFRKQAPTLLTKVLPDKVLATTEEDVAKGTIVGLNKQIRSVKKQIIQATRAVKSFVSTGDEKQEWLAREELSRLGQFQTELNTELVQWQTKGISPTTGIYVWRVGEIRPNPLEGGTHPARQALPAIIQSAFRDGAFYAAPSELAARDWQQWLPNEFGGRELVRIELTTDAKVIFWDGYNKAFEVKPSEIANIAERYSNKRYSEGDAYENQLIVLKSGAILKDAADTGQKLVLSLRAQLRTAKKNAVLIGREIKTATIAKDESAIKIAQERLNPIKASITELESKLEVAEKTAAAVVTKGGPLALNEYQMRVVDVRSTEAELAAAQKHQSEVADIVKRRSDLKQEISLSQSELSSWIDKRSTELKNDADAAMDQSKKAFIQIPTVGKTGYLDEDLRKMWSVVGPSEREVIFEGARVPKTAENAGLDLLKLSGSGRQKVLSWLIMNSNVLSTETKAELDSIVSPEVSKSVTDAVLNHRRVSSEIDSINATVKENQKAIIAATKELKQANFNYDHLEIAENRVLKLQTALAEKKLALERADTARRLGRNINLDVMVDLATSIGEYLRSVGGTLRSRDIINGVGKILSAHPDIEPETVTALSRAIVGKEMGTAGAYFLSDNQRKTLIQFIETQMGLTTENLQATKQYLQGSLFYSVKDEEVARSIIGTGSIKALPQPQSVVAAGKREAIYRGGWLVDRIIGKGDQEFIAIRDAVDQAKAKLKIALRIGTSEERIAARKVDANARRELARYQASSAAATTSGAEFYRLLLDNQRFFSSDEMRLINFLRRPDMMTPNQAEQQAGVLIADLEKKIAQVPVFNRFLMEIPEIYQTPFDRPKIPTVQIQAYARTIENPLLEVEPDGGITYVVDKDWAFKEANATYGPVSNVVAIPQDIPVSRISRIEVNPNMFASQEEADAIASSLRKQLSDRGYKAIVTSSPPKVLIQELWKAVHILSQPIESLDVGMDAAFSIWHGRYEYGAYLGKQYADEFAALGLTETHNKELIQLIESGKKMPGTFTDTQKQALDIWQRVKEETNDMMKQMGYAQEDIDKVRIPQMYKAWARVGAYVNPQGGRAGIVPKTILEGQFGSMTEAEAARDEALDVVVRMGLTPTKLMEMSETEVKTLGIHPALIRILNSEPLYDLRYAATMEINQVYKAMANKDLVTTLSHLRFPESNFYPLLTTVENAPKGGAGYVRVDGIPGLKYLSWERHGDVPVLSVKGLMAHPKVYQKLVDVFGAPWNAPEPAKALVNAYGYMHNGIKRFIMLNPVIHMWNLFSASMDANYADIVSAGKTLNYGRELWNSKDAMIKEAILSELQISRTSGSFELNKIEKDIEGNADSIGEKIVLSIPPDILAATKIIPKIYEWDQKMLWEWGARNLSIGTYAIRKAQLARLYPDIVQNYPEEFNRAVAMACNDMFGMLSKTYFNRSWRQLGNYLLFARNWVFSNARIAIGALTGSSRIFKGLSAPVREMLQNEYTVQLWNGVSGLMLYGELMNLSLSGQHIWENDEGYRLDIFTGMTNQAGTKVYIANPLFRYIADYIKLIGGVPTGTMRVILNKTAAELRVMGELAFNKNVATGKEIYPTTPDVPMSEKIKAIWDNAGNSLTPLRSFAGLPGKARLPEEEIIPFAGTWVRHGIPGGNPAEKLMNFEQAKLWQRNKYRDEINVLRQEEGPQAAIAESVERGMPVRSVSRGMLRDKFPLIMRWKNMPRKDKIEFLTALTPDERQQFWVSIRSEGTNAINSVQ